MAGDAGTGCGRRATVGLLLAGLGLAPRNPRATGGRVDLADEMDAAAAAGRRLVVAWERQGCQYCAELYDNHLTQPAIRDQVDRHFRWLRLDTEGAREVADLDGLVTTERQLARRWRVAVTPTIVFMPQSRQPAAPGHERAVARMNGLLAPPEFHGFLIYVAEGGYAQGQSFRAWWRARSG